MKTTIDTEVALELTSVVKTFPPRKGSDGFRLGPIDLAVPRGFVTGLVGANGAGKTTAIKIALGLTQPDGGAVSLIDKARVGVVFDQPAYVADWTAAQTGRALAPFYPSWDGARFDELLRWAGIAPGKRVKELSRGMGMKLQLAVALAHGAELLVLDEPSSGLDPLARSQLLDFVADFMTDGSHAVLFSTHITSDLDRIADYVTLLSAGRVLEAVSRHDLVDGYRLVRGPASALSPELRPLCRGLREHAAGWEALLATEDTVALRPGAVVEPPSLEDIVVHLLKEDSHV
ncbi:MAG: ABC transporter ATP-binding protein [Arachnia sp.]